MADEGIKRPIIENSAEDIKDTAMYVLGDMVQRSVDVLKEGFGDKLYNDLLNNARKYRESSEQVELRYAQNIKKAEELRLSLFANAEGRRVIALNKSLKAQEDALNEGYKNQMAIFEESRKKGEHTRKEEAAFKKKHEEALTELTKQGQEERKKIASEESAKIPGLAELKTAFAGVSKMFSFAAVLVTAITQSFDYSKASAGLGAARMQALGGAGGNLPTNMFSGMPAGLMSPVEKMQLMSKIFTEAPRLINETAESTHKFVGYMGLFGLNVEESSKILIDAQRSLGYNSGDLIGTFQLASGMNKKYGISVGENAGIIRDMTGSLRMMGLGAKEAAAIMNAIPTQNELGKITATELHQYTSAMADLIGGMAPSKMAGIMAFMKGGGIPTSAEMIGGGVGMPGMVGKLYERIRGGFGGKAEDNKLLIAEAFTKNMGIQIPINEKTMLTMDEILRNMPTNVDDIIKQLAAKDIKPMNDRIKEGMQTLTNMHGTLENIENILKTTLVPIAAVANTATMGLGKLLTSSASGNLVGSTVVGAAIGAPFGLGVPGAATGLIKAILEEALSRPAQVPGRSGG